MEAFTELPFLIKRAAWICLDSLDAFPSSLDRAQKIVFYLYILHDKKNKKTPHIRKVLSLSLFSRYFYGNCSNEVHAFVPSTLILRPKIQPAIYSEVNNPRILRITFLRGKFT